VLVLDDPMRGVDPATKQNLYGILGEVADAYGRAVSGLKRLPPNPAATGAAAALAGAFQAEQRAYSALARAAGHNDRKGYNTARGSITTAGSKVSAALGQLSHLGYVSG